MELRDDDDDDDDDEDMELEGGSAVKNMDWSGSLYRHRRLVEMLSTNPQKPSHSCFQTRGDLTMPPLTHYHRRPNITFYHLR
jgi:hypothetical protein